MAALIPLARGVWRLPLLPRDALNVYLVGDVVVDAGLRSSLDALITALRGRPVAAHLLTHAHPDHQGASAALCEALGVPLWCGARDREAAESGRFSVTYRGARRQVFRLVDGLGGPGRVVDRVVREGDRVADFEVIETPGHTPGHVALWRASDGVAILGDMASYRNPLAFSGGLRASAGLVTGDRSANRASIRKIADLGPRLVCFGHGPPLQDGARFVRWARSL